MEIVLESPKQLADRIGWPVSRVRGLISNKQLRHYRFGKSIMIPPEAITEYMNRIEVKPNVNGMNGADQTNGN